jgi:hypothetical protein
VTRSPGPPARCEHEGSRLSHLREAVRLRPCLAEARNNLGNALRETGRLAEARQSYAEALRISPTLAMTYNNMGQALLIEEMAGHRKCSVISPGLTRFEGRSESSVGQTKNQPKSGAFPCRVSCKAVSSKKEKARQNS